jgi:hypothetical protein
MLVMNTTRQMTFVLCLQSCLLQLIDLLARFTLQHSLDVAFILAMLLCKNMQERLLLVRCWFPSFDMAISA